MRRRGVVIALLLAAATLVSAQPNAICMPTNYSWPGRTVTIWGAVRGGVAPYTYEWDFGDASPPASGNVTNVNYIAVTHSYATLGPRTCTLTITDSNMDTDVETVMVNVLPDGWDTRRLAGIEDGLRYLYTQFNWTYGYWRTGPYYGSTAIACLAFQDAGHRPNGDPGTDVYVEVVRSGIQYLFDVAGSQAIGPQAYIPDPDTNDNGIGIYWNSNNYMYEQGIVMMALVATGLPNETVSSTNATTDGKTYKEVVQDACDLCAWAQNDGANPGPRGGWRYSPNYGDSDNSVSQWPAIGCEAAETNWGCEIAANSKSELELWLDYSRSSSGSWGYTSPEYLVNVAKAGAGICMLSWCDYPTSDPRIQGAIAYTDAKWLWNGGNDYRNISDFYAMYGVTKGARIAMPPINTFGTHDYWHEYVEWMYGVQHASGYMPTSYRMNSFWTTAFGVLIYLPGIAELPPVAVITAPNEVPPDTAFPMDGEKSWHQDPARSIVAWLWDFDDADGLDWNNPDASGKFVNNPGYTLPGGVPQQDFTVTLRVEDDEGRTDTDSHPISVDLNNHAPVADPGGPYSAQVNEVITLDGSASYDPDEVSLGDFIQTWSWDLDGDGTFGDDFGETVQHSWDHVFSGFIGLIVEDSFGEWSDPADAYVTAWTSNTDAYIADSDISFTPPLTKGVGTFVTCTAVVHVDCDSDPIQELTVQFYDGDPDIAVVPIGPPHVLTNLQPCDAVPVDQEVDFTGNVEKEVYVRIDPNEDIEEWDEDNNEAHGYYNHSTCGGWDTGWALISLPLIPDSFLPENCLDDVAAGQPMIYRVMSFTQDVGYLVYGLHWTMMEMEVGYWLKLEGPAIEEMFGATPKTDDMVLPLPVGWVLVPVPFNTDIHDDDLVFTDGMVMLSHADAVTAGWVQSVMFGWPNPAGPYFEVPTDDMFLRPWNSYWFLTYEAGISLVMPAP